MELLDDLLGIESTNRAFGIAEHEHRPNSLLEGILFNIHFIVTYQLCLLSLTAVLTISHWFAILRRRRQIRRDVQRHADVHHTSSSSSVASSQVNERTKDTGHINETTSLLRVRPSIESIGTLRRCRLWLRSLLMMHPIFKKDLAGNDTTAFILLLLGLNLSYAFYKAPLSRSLIFIFADRVGLLFVANLPWLYLLAAKNQPFRLLTGSSYEGLNVLHRELGKFLAILAILHTVGMIMVWYDFLLPRGLDFWWYISRPLIWLGLGAFGCYEGLSITSLKNFREWWYELFLGTHVILQTGGLVFLWFHHHRARLYVGIALCIFLVDRLWYRLTLKTRTFTAQVEVLEDGQTVLLSAQWPLQATAAKWLAWLRPQDLNYGWKPTDHVFLTVPALATKHKLQAHPFTIASAAPEEGDDRASLDLLMRVRSGFTKDLLEHTKLNGDVTIRLDGPYGSPHALEMLQMSEVAVVLAGGSGIAVAYPLVWALARSSKARTTSKICLIWIIHDPRHISWIGQYRLTELHDLGVTVVIPPPTSKAGRPDIAGLIEDNVAKLSDGDLHYEIGLVVSGPDAMNRSARNAAARMARQGIDIHVAVEVFDW